MELFTFVSLICIVSLIINPWFNEYMVTNIYEKFPGSKLVVSTAVAKLSGTKLVVSTAVAKLSGTKLVVSTAVAKLWN